MQIEIFDAIHQQEKTYWWFVGRRRLVLDFFARYRAAAMAVDRPKVLDMGCGTGGMLEDFAATAKAFGTDVSAVALQYCRTRGQRRLCFADGRSLPFHDGGFDCIVALDVIEHIDDDLAVLREFFRTCAQEGAVIITVPALRWLWTTRDERLAHFRRYHRAELIARAEQAGFQVAKCSYYCVSMFPVFAAIVGLDRLLGRKPDVKQDVPKIPRWLNTLLLRALLLEQWLMRWVNYPFGVSLFAVLRKPVPPTRQRPESRAFVRQDH